MYQISLKSSALKNLNKLSKIDYYRVIKVLQSLAIDPFIGKKLKGEYQDYYSARVWPYRIIYRIYKKELLVLVIHIGHRQSVYK